MSPEYALRNRLIADATVVALIGTRIYPRRLPQNPQLPAVTYSRVRGTSVTGHTGPSGYAAARLQFDSWAVTDLAARNLSGALKLRLNGFKGFVSGVTFHHVLFDSDQDLDEDVPVANGTRGLYRNSAEYQVAFAEEC